MARRSKAEIWQRRKKAFKVQNIRRRNLNLATRETGASEISVRLEDWQEVSEMIKDNLATLELWKRRKIADRPAVWTLKKIQ